MESQDEALYIRGFNSGYMLEQYEPALLAKVLHTISPATEYVSGLSGGQLEYQQEKAREELDKLSQLRDKGREQERGVDLP